MDRETYLNRKGERLVVQGFRHWLSGYEFGDVACWEQAWSLFTAELGADFADGVTQLRNYFLMFVGHSGRSTGRGAMASDRRSRRG